MPSCSFKLIFIEMWNVVVIKQRLMRIIVKHSVSTQNEWENTKTHKK